MKTYNKILIAKKSPKNKCFCEDGEILVIATKHDKMRGKIASDGHFFVGINTRTPSLYGWVKTIEEPITPLELAKMNYISIYGKEPREGEISQEEIEHFQWFLDIIDKQKDGTPMACNWLEIQRPTGKYRKLRFHKVIFYEV